MRIIGLAGELGYVAQGDTVMAAVGGHRLAALVVESERVVEVMEKEAGRCAVLRGVSNMPMLKPPNLALDHLGLVHFTDPPEQALPRGARYAVNQVQFERLAVEDGLKQRLRLEVWWWLLGSAIVFASVQDLQDFKLKHGRKHVLAAPKPDGTWLVISGMFVKPGRSTPRVVELSTEEPATRSPEYRQAMEELEKVNRDFM